MTAPIPNAIQDRHSRRVRILKVSLPLLALAIMSSLFLFSRSLTMEGALPFAEVDVADRLRQPKMTQVAIATTSEAGAVIEITAESLTPTGLNSATARGALGTLTSLSGRVTMLNAAVVDFDDTAGTAALTGGVIVTSAGYEVATEALDMNITAAELQSRSSIQAKGPLGRLDAGRLRATQNDGGAVLVFNSGVRLLYLPQ